MIKTDEFCKLMTEYAEYLESVEGAEREKLEAFLSGELERIEHAIANVQVMEKQMQSFERRRVKLLAAQDMQDKTFAQIVSEMDGETKTQMESLMERMRKAAESVRYFNNKSLQYVKARMRFSQQAEAKETGYTQDKKKTKPDSPSLFTKKI